MLSIEDRYCMPGKAVKMFHSHKFAEDTDIWPNFAGPLTPLLSVGMFVEVLSY